MVKSKDIDKKDSQILTSKELGFLLDKEFLTAKINLIQKIERILKKTELDLIKLIQKKEHLFPQETLLKSGKISKGENYNGFPYLILDYPRLNSSKSLFLYRTMFWWGNFFSCTIHIKGDFLNEIRNSLSLHYDTFQKSDLLIFKGEDEWVHDLGNKGYKPISNLNSSTWNRIIKEQEFIKVSKRISLNDYSQLVQTSSKMFNTFLNSLNN